MPLSLRFDEQAEADLVSIATWVASRADPATARDYITRIRARCERLIDNPRGGRIRRRTRPAIRSVPFERNATILYRAGRSDLIILRILHQGHDSDAILRKRR